MTPESKNPEPNDAQAEIIEGEIAEIKVNAHYTVRLDDGMVLSCHLSRWYYGRDADFAFVQLQVGARVKVKVLSDKAGWGRIMPPQWEKCEKTIEPDANT